MVAGVKQDVSLDVLSTYKIYLCCRLNQSVSQCMMRKSDNEQHLYFQLRSRELSIKTFNWRAGIEAVHNYGLKHFAKNYML